MSRKTVSRMKAPASRRVEHRNSHSCQRMISVDVLSTVLDSGWTLSPGTRGASLETHTLSSPVLAQQDCSAGYRRARVCLGALGNRGHQ